MEFTLSDFLRLLKKTWWIIVLAAVAGAAIAFVLAAVTSTPTYSSQVVVMLDYRSDPTEAKENWTAQDDLNYSKSMISNCVTILKQNRFYDEVSKKLPDLAKYSTTKLEEIIEYQTASDTSTFIITVSSKAADTSFEVAKAIEAVVITDGYISGVYPNFDSDNIAINSINLVVKAEKPDSNNDYVTFIIIGAIAAIVVAAVVIFIVDRQYIRVRDEKSLGEIYGYPVFGVIPESEKSDIKHTGGAN